jgi:type IV secretory pathway VirB2 component (pilin)
MRSPADGNGGVRVPAGTLTLVRVVTAALFVLIAALMVAALVYPVPAHPSCSGAHPALERALTVRRALVFGAFAGTAAALICCAAGLLVDGRRLPWYAVAGLVTLVLLVPLEALEWFALDPCTSGL